MKGLSRAQELAVAWFVRNRHLGPVALPPVNGRTLACLERDGYVVHVWTSARGEGWRATDKAVTWIEARDAEAERPHVIAETTTPARVTAEKAPRTGFQVTHGCGMDEWYATLPFANMAARQHVCTVGAEIPAAEVVQAMLSMVPAGHPALEGKVPSAYPWGSGEAAVTPWQAPCGKRKRTYARARRMRAGL